MKKTYEVHTKDGHCFIAEGEDLVFFNDIIFFGDLKIHKDNFSCAAPYNPIKFDVENE